MIDPFEPSQVRRAGNGRIISYGTSSYGYDVRCANEFKIFTNINSTIVDPKEFDERSFVDLKADICIIPPNSFALARTVEYFRIPRSVLTICLGKSTYARCFSGDTRVALVDGTAPTLEEMATRHDRGELFWGYSIGPRGQVMVTLLDAPRFVARDSVVEVTLDNGKRIRATMDHQFLRRNGRLVSAGDLRPGDSLMPLYRNVCRGYEMLYEPLTGHLYPTHRLADEWNVRHEIYEEVAGTHRHHIDFNRRNNVPSNIQRMPATEHIGSFRGSPSRNHRVESVRSVTGEHDTYCLTVPEAGNFALEAGVFTSNCGIIVNVTPLEPEWEGHVTLEFSNTTTLPAKIYANEGAAQMIFFESDEVCEVSYKDRGGKYQGQRGVTLPKA